jgi:hypothetical protein
MTEVLSDEWVSVKDRLPTKHADYLVTYQCRAMTGAFSEPSVRQALWIGEWELYQRERVIAWRHLPPPFEEK